MIFRRKKRSKRRRSSLSTSSSRMAPKLKRRITKRRTPGKTLNTSHSNSNNSRNSKQKRQNRRGLRGLLSKTKRSFLLIVIGAITIAIVHTLFIADTLTITDVEVIEEGELAPRHTIQSILKEFEGNNLLLTDTNEIESYLQELYPEYQNLKISKRLPDTLVVTLEKHSEVANVIIQDPEDNETLYILNTAGRITLPESEEENTEFPTIFIESEESIVVGSEVITQEHLAFVLEAIQNFEDKFGMVILQAQYYQVEREVHLWTERNFYVWLDMTQSLDDQLNKLKKALPKLNIYSLDIEYIDLRISGAGGEKIIYKPR